MPPLLLRRKGRAAGPEHSPAGLLELAEIRDGHARAHEIVDVVLHEEAGEIAAELEIILLRHVDVLVGIGDRYGVDFLFQPPVEVVRGHGDPPCSGNQDTRFRPGKVLVSGGGTNRFFPEAHTDRGPHEKKPCSIPPPSMIY